ncbi:CRISPR system precrRNA processing endoribonuclease RAMP protein Cas6 [Actinomadura sp. NPDC048955]|uniref:CRISPR system precrRNA processing endoribonuclease RAMP protein Cas6 n=1 Tax=Actinomadura sp. NPDC048955 TaxID=3158228 RepID=UPI0033C9A05F
MPARIIVRLEPAGGRPFIPPPHTGPAVNAAFLAALRDTGGDALSAALHETRPPKPFALTPLLDERNRLASASSKQVRFEIGVLADSLTAPALQAFAAIRDVRVARCLYKVAGLELAGADPFSDLLAGAGPADRWTLQIHTPVAFFTAKEEGARRVRPFPEAEWVFADLYRKWNTFAPDAALGETTAQLVAQNLEVADYRLAMAEHLIKVNVPPVRGSVGRIVYRVADTRRSSAEARAGLEALVRFSAYSGIGDRTTTGMGYVLPSR